MKNIYLSLFLIRWVPLSYNDLFSKGSLAKKAAFKVAEHLQHKNHKIMKHKVHACKPGAVTKKEKGCHCIESKCDDSSIVGSWRSLLFCVLIFVCFFMKNKAKANQATNEQHTPNSVSERRVTAEWHEWEQNYQHNPLNRFDLCSARTNL